MSSQSTKVNTVYDDGDDDIDHVKELVHDMIAMTPLPFVLHLVKKLDDALTQPDPNDFTGIQYAQVDAALFLLKSSSKSLARDFKNCGDPLIHAISVLADKCLEIDQRLSSDNTLPISDVCSFKFNCIMFFGVMSTFINNIFNSPGPTPRSDVLLRALSVVINGLSYPQTESASCIAFEKLCCANADVLARHGLALDLMNVVSPRILGAVDSGISRGPPPPGKISLGMPSEKSLQMLVAGMSRVVAAVYNVEDQMSIIKILVDPILRGCRNAMSVKHEVHIKDMLSLLLAMTKNYRSPDQVSKVHAREPVAHLSSSSPYRSIPVGLNPLTVIYEQALPLLAQCCESSDSANPVVAESLICLIKNGGVGESILSSIIELCVRRFERGHACFLLVLRSAVTVFGVVVSGFTSTLMHVLVTAVGLLMSRYFTSVSDGIYGEKSVDVVLRRPPVKHVISRPPSPPSQSAFDADPEITISLFSYVCYGI